MVLNKKVAVVFAANGAISSAVAKSFAQEGAIVYLTGRNEAALKSLAENIRQSGGIVKTAVVDACDEQAIDQFFQTLIREQNRLDIVFNGIGIRPSKSSYGTPASTLSFEHFMKPIEVHVGSQFLTARLAAKYMMQTESQGTILTLTSSLSRLKVPFMTGFLAACTAIEGLTRGLAAEYGRNGIKVICLNPTALYGTRTIEETTEANARLIGVSPEQWNAQLSQQYLLGRSPSLQEVGDMAAFLASDKGVVLNSHVVDIDAGSIMVI